MKSETKEKMRTNVLELWLVEGRRSMSVSAQVSDEMTQRFTVGG